MANLKFVTHCVLAYSVRGELLVPMFKGILTRRLSLTRASDKCTQRGSISRAATYARRPTTTYRLFAFYYTKLHNARNRVSALINAG